MQLRNQNKPLYLNFLAYSSKNKTKLKLEPNHGFI